jgi:hypothetical protein
MEVNPIYWHHRSNGSIEIEEIPREKWSHHPSNKFCTKQFIYTWIPPYQIAIRLPKKFDGPDGPDRFALSLVCLVNKAGNRRFYPVQKGARILIMKACVSGSAILDDRNEIDNKSLFSHSQARTFYSYSQHLREYLGQRISLGRSILGSTDSNTDLLPEDLWLDCHKHGKRWQYNRLQKEGLKAARDAGKENPTPDEILQYRLLEAAKLNPLRVNSKEANSLVRMALFAFGPVSEHLKPSELAYVAEQVRESMKDYLDSIEEYKQWIKDPKSNLPHRIAKRKTPHLSGEHVKRALLKLAWISCEMLGKAIDAQMRVFREALTPPLNRDEDLLYEQMYLAHPNFGGLPLVLLYERFDFIKPIILQMWERPEDPDLVAVFHRMLWYYAEIIEKRREEDRRYKQRAQQRNQSGRPAKEYSITEEDEAALPEISFFREIALILAKERGLIDDIDDFDSDVQFISEDSKQIYIHASCPRNFPGEDFFVSREEFKRVGQKLDENH